MKRRTFVSLAAVAGASLATPKRTAAQSDVSATPAAGDEATTESGVQTGYAPINGMQMYYEVHGTGEPLVLLHGAYMFTGAMEPLLFELAKSHQVIAFDFQGHGRTADIKRPITYENLADDAAALMDYLSIDQADVFGFSMGASTGLQLTLRHPEKVRKLVAASGQYRLDGMYPEVMALIAQITPEAFMQTPFYDAYAAIAPDPSQFPQLVEKLKTLDAVDFAWSEEEIAAISQPVLLIYGDADVIRPEHALALFRLLGGGVPGDLTGLPKAQLAILPGTTHINVLDPFPWLASMVDEFLAVPLPLATPTATS